MGPEDSNKVLMVTAAILRPGKHQYLVKSHDEDYRSMARAFIGKTRRDPPLPQLSDKYISLKRELLTKENSVFKDFKEDTFVYQKQMLEHDFKHWHISRTVKVEFVVSKLLKLLILFPLL